MIYVYSTPDCVQCAQTKKFLDRQKVPYVNIDVTKDDEAAEGLRARGVRRMPFVVTPDDEWSGFRPDKLKAIGK